MSCLMSCVSSEKLDDEVAKAQRERDKERKRLNKVIEDDIERARESRKKEHRILLLGCGQAGKSTFIKQMRIIHSEGFQDDEKAVIKRDIASNIGTAIMALIEHSLFDENSTTDKDKKLKAAIMKVTAELDPKFNSVTKVFDPSIDLILELADDIKFVWTSDPIQQAYANRNTFQLIDCAKYFLSRVHEIMAPDYVPNNNDITQTRVRTEGIIEHEFEILGKGPARGKIIMIDVGGQRNERRKWIHCFEDVMLLMFLTAVSEFDQVCEEDDVTNRVRESLNLFETILDYVYFEQTNVILFLNKKDVLEEKLKAGKQISKYFPEFPGPEGDYAAAVDFFKSEFLGRNEVEEVDRKVYVHETCATDEQNIRVVDVVVQATILEEIFKNAL